MYVLRFSVLYNANSPRRRDLLEVAKFLVSYCCNGKNIAANTDDQKQNDRQCVVN